MHAGSRNRRGNAHWFNYPNFISKVLFKLKGVIILDFFVFILLPLKEMDRWGDGDGTNTGPKKPMGAVARLGMGGFVKAEKGEASDCIACLNILTLSSLFTAI